jgi:hypothetical protein
MPSGGVFCCGPTGWQTGELGRIFRGWPAERRSPSISPAPSAPGAITPCRNTSPKRAPGALSALIASLRSIHLSERDGFRCTRCGDQATPRGTPAPLRAVWPPVRISRSVRPTHENGTPPSRSLDAHANNCTPTQRYATVPAREGRQTGPEAGVAGPLIGA